MKATPSLLLKALRMNSTRDESGARVTAPPSRRVQGRDELVYVTDIRDFRAKANEYFATRGRSRSFNSQDGTAKLVLCGTEVFYLGMPMSQREGLSFEYEVSSTTRTQDFFGAGLGSVENTCRDVEGAFDVIDCFARVHLTDKYLACGTRLPPIVREARLTEALRQPLSATMVGRRRATGEGAIALTTHQVVSSDLGMPAPQ